MAVDSVGGKIMINRAPDATRDAAALQRRSDLVKTQMDRQAQTEAEQMATEVVDVYEPSEAAIHRERERERRRQQGEEEEFLEYELTEEEMAIIEAEFLAARQKREEENADVGQPPLKRIDIRI
ncbi:hypothetical protein LJC20_02040 [Eubacteriales bacterium OttesenSCG-928-M02]|nr:hypothetical protein [Eubacteriales bacterium OttesenSCG-928-M02]